MWQLIGANTDITVIIQLWKVDNLIDGEQNLTFEFVMSATDNVMTLQEKHPIVTKRTQISNRFEIYFFFCVHVGHLTLHVLQIVLFLWYSHLVMII